MAQRELTETEKQMGEVLTNHYMAPELKVERLLRIVEALVNENLAPALSRARVEALEGAIRAMARQPIGDATASETRSMDIDAVRALIATPAPATIPVERVRTVLLTYRNEDDPAARDLCAIIDQVLGDLGVGRDADGEAKRPPGNCPGCFEVGACAPDCRVGKGEVP